MVLPQQEKTGGPQGPSPTSPGLAAAAFVGRTAPHRESGSRAPKQQSGSRASALQRLPVRAGLVSRAEDWPFQGEIWPLALQQESQRS